MEDFWTMCNICSCMVVSLDFKAYVFLNVKFILTYPLQDLQKYVC